MSDIASVQTRITRWDRAAIVALGGAGCALSYDALQQMATAIHIRGILTFVFPLVIDGFIAYGVRALLVLRAAPLAARCYVWFLFGTATAASIWANALHAVRLNQLQSEGDGLRLGDITVGILSTLAPLALAGAVHLYILIARRVAGAEVSEEPGTSTVRTEQITAVREDTKSPVVPPAVGHQVEEIDRPAVPQDTDNTKPVDEGTLSGHPDDPAAGPGPDQHDRAADRAGRSDSRPRPATVLHAPRRSVAATGTRRINRADTPDQPGTAPTDADLLAIARPAVKAAGRLTRQVVGNAIRSNHGLGNDRLTHLMRLLREEAQQQGAN